ncbi:MAG: fluoride efflux transporter CrcB [Coriobacteriia bacterium]
MNPGNTALVVLGAGIGGGLRYVVGGWIAERWGTSFPWHTLAVNISGAFLLGSLMALSVERGMLTPGWRLFLGVGILGGYTTFSTLAYESVALMERGLVLSGAFNMFGSGLAGLAAVFVGLVIGRML